MKMKTIYAQGSKEL